MPPLQVSLLVQASPSLHGAVLLLCTQPVAGLHESSVQTLLSLQLGGDPPTHEPRAQVSLVVQAFPSLHGLVLLVCTQPVTGLQLSSVQTLLSLQLAAGPPTHAPAAQVSLVVQAFPSLQGLVLLMWVHPLAGLQASVVQTFPSSQLGAGPPTQVPPLQVSLVVQAFPSLQGLELLVCTQPVAGLQLSSVQTFPSSQLGAGPPTHAPAAQVSLVVQAFPSLQGAVLLMCTQPVAGVHESSVQTLLSLQLGAGPPTHVPP